MNLEKTLKDSIVDLSIPRSPPRYGHAREGLVVPGTEKACASNRGEDMYA